MSNIKEVNKKLFQIQMLLEECTVLLKEDNDKAEEDLSKLKSGITKSSQFVFGE